MSKIVIKVNCVKLGVTKAFQFDPSVKVSFVISQIQEKVAGVEPDENYGLFIKDCKNSKKSYWLLNSRTLQFYDIQNGWELQYINKNRYLKVKMLDETIKTVLVDDSKSVGHALDIICEKIGLTNSDEYSLFIEEERQEDVENVFTEETQLLQPKVGTLRKMSNAIMSRVDEHELKKIQTLKKQAHTDNDTKWLANEKTLWEAGVTDDSLVVIRRRFTYEQSVNITNPVEINLAYVQSRDAILDGSHPCSMEQAAKFAAFQIQVQHGNYDDLRYKTGWIDVKEFLPKEYQKSKEVLKKIKEEHKEMENLDELDVKYKYIQLCQNLPTYGVTFFVVREKMKGKNKLVPRLLGVNKESVMRVDEKTKEVLKMWPLTTIKNWASSSNSFTLDFGDYTEGMVSVQTLEGPQIGQLIGGYIDIIMRRMHKLKFTHVKDDDIGIIGEDSSVPHKIRHIQHKRNDLKESLPQYGKMAQISGTLSPGQRALINNLDDSGKAVLIIYDDLEEENPYAELEPLRPGGKTDEFSLDKAMGDIYASVASVISRSGNKEEDDYTAVGAGVSTITANMKDLSQHLRFRAPGLEDDGNDLLDAARRLADAFKDLMISLNPIDEKPREDLLNAAKGMSEAGVCIEHILEKKEPNEYQATLVQVASGIERAAVMLGHDAIRMAATLDSDNSMKIHKAADLAKMSAVELLACTKVLALHMDKPQSKEQMILAIQNASRDLNALTGLCLVATNDDDLLGKIKAVAQALTDALNNLLQKVHCEENACDACEDDACEEDVTEKNVYEMILDANDALFRSFGDPDEMVRQATILGQATSQLIKGIEGHAKGIDDDDDEKNKLLDAVKGLTDATTVLLMAAKKVKQNPDSKPDQENLKSSAVTLRLTTNNVTNNALKKTLVIKLNSTAKQAVQASTHVISMANAAAPYNGNPLTQEQFKAASAELISHNAKDLVRAVKDSESKLGNPTSQLNLITSVKYFLPAASRMVAISKTLFPTVTNEAIKLQLADANLNAEKALNELRNAAEKAAEGQEECDRAVNAINKEINNVDQALMAAIGDNLTTRITDSIKGLEEKIIGVCHEIRDDVPDIVEYAQGVPEKIGASVIKLAEMIEPLTTNSIAFAANLSTASSKQTHMLDMTKTVLESIAQLVTAAKDAGGNPEAIKHHTGVDEGAEDVMEAIKDLMLFVKATTGDIDNIAYLTSAIEKVRDEVAQTNIAPNPLKSFVEYQENMFRVLKAIAKDSHDMVSKSQSSPKDISFICEDIYENYHDLVDDLKYAAVFINPEIGDELAAHVQKLGDHCKNLIQSAGECQGNENNASSQQEMSAKAKAVSLEVTHVLADLQRASVGTKSCQDALNMLSGLIADIDTNVMFAETGTLHPENEAPFSAHRDLILLNSQNFVKETKVLVGAAHAAQDQLAACVTEVLSSTNKLLESVKLGAASLGSEDRDGQILLLNAVKNVASALSDLMNATRTACGRPKDDPSADELKIYAKHMVSNLTSLLKTVRSVEDKALRGSRAIESTVESIKQAVMHYQPDEKPAMGEATPEDLIRSTKGVTLATAKAVSAANSLRQADIIEAANLGRKHCYEMYEIAKAAVSSCESDSIRNAVIVKVQDSSQAYCNVLQHVAVVIAKPTPQSKQEMTSLSKKVAYHIGEVVKVAEILKGNDLVNPDDPNIIAENELLGAAASIEAAAKKLAELQPKARPKTADESLNFEEQILEAAKSITTATHALVKAASFAQKELVAQGLVCSPLTDHYADTQWSQGLISAARLVAEATGSLCEAANAAVLGNASQEKLIASAQSVSASTTQLLVACRVKADTFSKTQKGLQAAGSAVKRATDHLVRAAEEAAVFEDDETDGYMPSGGVRTGRLIDEMNAQVEILRREKELEKARKKLERIRLTGYGKGWKNAADIDEED